MMRVEMADVGQLAPIQRQQQPFLAHAVDEIRGRHDQVIALATQQFQLGVQTLVAVVGRVAHGNAGFRRESFQHLSWQVIRPIEEAHLGRIPSARHGQRQQQDEQQGAHQLRRCNRRWETMTTVRETANIRVASAFTSGFTPMRTME